MGRRRGPGYGPVGKVPHTIVPTCTAAAFSTVPCAQHHYVCVVWLCVVFTHYPRRRVLGLQRYVKSRTTLGGREGKRSRWSNFWSPLETKGRKSTMPKNGNHTGQQSSKRRAGSGHRGQRLAPNDLGGVGETSPPVASSREGDNSTKPELNHVQSTTRGTDAYGNPVPVPSSKQSTSRSGEDTEDAGSSSAESVQIKSASSSDVD